MPIDEAPLQELFKAVVDRSEPPSAQARARETDAALERALAQLSERSRQAIFLRTYERRSYQEIGSRLSCSEEAARKIWVRAIDELRELLGPDNGPT